MELVVDFNDVERGSVSGLIENVRPRGGVEIARGAGIVVVDDEGHRAWGTIERIENGLVDVAIDWDTWTTDTPWPFASSSPNRAAKSVRVKVRQAGSTSGGRNRGSRHHVVGA
jgi:hypothetical protein